ncbi:MAG: amidohydrolase [Isosphaeraceae bacterium]|nr:amidohydrolase [Isosphaeraceae bacterium]
MWSRRQFLGQLAVLPACYRTSDEPDTVYENGRVVTLDPANRIVRAVAVRQGQILAVGTEQHVREAATRHANIVDLRGRTLLPGFYAAHDHLPQSGLVALFQVDLNSPPIGRIETIADLIGALREKARRTPRGEWIIGRGYDDTLLREQRHPDRHDLDRASTEHPIWIVHTSGHLGVANSQALALAGLDKSTPAPKQGVIRREADGEPNGVIEENGSLIMRLIPPYSREQRLRAIAHDDQVYLAKGVTTTVIAGATPQRVADLRAAAARDEFHLSAVCYLSSGIPDAFPDAVALGADRVRVAGVKLWQDGSLQGYTGHLTAPYFQTPPGRPDYRGYSLRTREQLAAIVEKHHRAGYQVAIHANGDAGIDEALYAFREAQRAVPRPEARHRIEHCQTPRPDQLDAMRELAITPSFFVGHVYYWGDRHRDIFLGPQRAARISPLASASRRGIPFTIHNDTPVTPVDPLLLVWCAVNRLTRSGSVLGPDERIPVVPALRAVTSVAAWQTHEEATKGTLEPGKAADFVILEQDPLTIAPTAIKEIRVLETLIGGQTVYRR